MNNIVIKHQTDLLTPNEATQLRVEITHHLEYCFTESTKSDALTLVSTIYKDYDKFERDINYVKQQLRALAGIPNDKHITINIPKRINAVINHTGVLNCGFVQGFVLVAGKRITTDNLSTIIEALYVYTRIHKERFMNNLETQTKPTNPNRAPDIHIVDYEAAPVKTMPYVRRS